MPKNFFVGAKAFIVCDNKVLLLKSPDKQNGGYYWDLPGGRMEEGESIEDALFRELHEEIPGIKDITINSLISAYKHPRTLSSGHDLMLLIYKVHATFPHITISDEHHDYKWIQSTDLDIIQDEAVINSHYKEMILLHV